MSDEKDASGPVKHSARWPTRSRSASCCQVFWGSHGCLDRPPGHDGNHVCDCGHEITNSGDDGTGFIWGMYGADSPEELAGYLDLVYEAGNMLPGGRVPE